MAGDWIKMRTDLYRDPKVCVMADLLLCDFGSPSRNVTGDVTVAQRAVTRSVTRNACVGALLSVWGVVRHRGKRHGDDLCCARVTVSVIDDIADMPGFGDSMKHVGWVIETPEGLTFPRFFEDYNTSPGEPVKSKAAERQARYRRSRVAQQGVTQTVTGGAQRTVTRDVTRDVTVTPREEKNREEKDTAGAVSVCDQTPKAKVPRKFVAPTVEEVRAYCTERANAVDPERFVDHYAARGWVMSNGRQIKDWQACVRTWEKNDAERRHAAGGQIAGHVLATTGNVKRGGFATHEYDREAANNAALADWAIEEGVLPGDGGAHHAQKNLEFHEATTERVVLRSAAVPGEGGQSVGRGACNVGDAIPGGRRPVQALPAEDAEAVRPDGG